MANVRMAKVDDVVKCNVLGEEFFAEVRTEPEQVSPRVYEVSIRRIGGHPAFANQNRYKTVRGRQVVALYRKLKS